MLTQPRRSTPPEGSSPAQGEGGRRRGHHHQPPAGKRALPGQVIAFVLVAYLVAALLGSDSLVGLARRQPFGWQRSVALGAARGLDRVADFASLDRPARAVRRAQGKEHPRYDVDALAASTAATGDGGGAAAIARGPVSAAAPLSVYVGGDSMAREVADGLARAAPASLVNLHEDFQISTGLSRPDFFDWPQRLARVIVERRPDAFVVIFGANDDQDLETAVGVLEAGSPAWQTEYRARVSRVMDLLHQPATTTLWVGPPVMRSRSFDSAIAAMDAIYREEAARRPWIRYLDTRGPFSGPDGSYLEESTSPAGDVVTMRQRDGVHWSVAGSTIVGDAVWAALQEQWAIR